MALAQEKRGGPYTKREQEERRLDVYHLHFEEKLPAVAIANILKLIEILLMKILNFVGNS